MRIATLLLSLAAAGGWGVGAILIKRGTDVASPTTILAFQYGAGFVVVAAWIVATRGLDGAIEAVERHWPLLVLITALQLAAYIAFIVAVNLAGEGSLPTATVIAIAASYPALAAVLSGPMLGEQLAWNHALGVALVVAGVVIAQAL